MTNRTKNEKGEWQPVFVKLHANLSFLFKYAEKMAVHLDLKGNKELQDQIKSIQTIDSDDEFDDDDEESSDYVELILNFFSSIGTGIQAKF